MIRRTLLFVLLVLVGLPLKAADLDVYNLLTYRKIQANQIQENVELVRRWVLPVYEDRVERGEVSSWAMWRVRFPAGGDYDLVSVSVADNYAAHAPGDGFRQAFDRVHGSHKWQRFLDEITPTGHVVRTEIWRQRSGIGGDAANDPDPFIRVNFAKAAAGKEPAYLALLDNYATPFMEERLKTQGETWSTWRLLDPGPGASPHNFATSTGFKSFAAMEPRDDGAQVFARAHPDEDIQDISAQFRDAASPVRQEVWELMLQAN